MHAKQNQKAVQRRVTTSAFSVPSPQPSGQFSFTEAAPITTSIIILKKILYGFYTISIIYLSITYLPFFTNMVVYYTHFLLPLGFHMHT